MRSLIVFVGVAFPVIAYAQPASVQCKSTETQAECHARLRCRADEELEACQRRLTAAQNDDRTGREQQERDDRSGRDDSRNDRRDDRGADDRRGNHRSERRGDDRGRWRDDDRGGRDRGRRSRGGGGGGGGFVANKTFGLGLELGQPSGLNGKLFIGPSTAIDFGLGYAYEPYYYGDGIHLYGDVLFHPTTLIRADAFHMPFYVGVGLRFWDFDYCDRNICTYGGSALGVRVPLGIAFDFNRVPLDIFMQLVPVIDFVRGDYYDRYRDRTYLRIDGSVGIRFWFN